MRQRSKQANKCNQLNGFLNGVDDISYPGEPPVNLFRAILFPAPTHFGDGFRYIYMKLTGQRARIFVFFCFYFSYFPPDIRARGVPTISMDGLSRKNCPISIRTVLLG